MVRAATLYAAPAVRIDCAGETDRGRVRRENQDQFLIAELGRSLEVRSSSLADERTRPWAGQRTAFVLGVADGIAGTPAGRHASALTLETMTRLLLEQVPWTAPPGEDQDALRAQALTEAVLGCQQALELDGRRRPERRGMGTTLTVAVVIFPRLSLVHVGDSRCYLRRGGELRQLTQDHTLAQQLIDEGVLDPAEAASSRYQHVLWNAVGGGSGDLLPDVHHLTLEPHDTLLLCTDGVNKHVSDAAMAARLEESPDAAAGARGLVEAANAAGGSDNSAVVVARFLPEDEAGLGGGAASRRTR